MVTRIWKGRHEASDKDYFVGQILIETGQKKGCYLSLTREFDVEELAIKSLSEKISKCVDDFSIQR